MKKICYEDFVFRPESGLFYKNNFLITADFSVLQKRNRILEDGQTYTDYLVRVEYITARPALDKWLTDLKNIDFWEFEVNDILLTSNQRKLIIFKLLYEAERADTHICYDNISGLCSIDEKLLRDVVIWNLFHLIE